MGNNMFIDGVIGMVGVCMFAKSILVHNYDEAFIWAVVSLYGWAEFMDRKLDDR